MTTALASSTSPRPARRRSPEIAGASPPASTPASLTKRPLRSLSSSKVRSEVHLSRLPPPRRRLRPRSSNSPPSPHGACRGFLTEVQVETEKAKILSRRRAIRERQLDGSAVSDSGPVSGHPASDAPDGPNVDGGGGGFPFGRGGPTSIVAAPASPPAADEGTPPFIGTLVSLIPRPAGATREERMLTHDASRAFVERYTPVSRGEQLKVLLDHRERGALDDAESAAEKHCRSLMFRCPWRSARSRRA